VMGRNGVKRIKGGDGRGKSEGGVGEERKREERRRGK